MDNGNDAEYNNRMQYDKQRPVRSLAPFAFLIILSIVMAFAVAILLRQWFENNHRYLQVSIERTEATMERDELLSQLNELDVAFQDLIATNEELQEQLDDKRAEIASMRRGIGQGVNSGQAAEYRNRINQLNDELIIYQNEVELLLAENQALSGENAQMASALNETTQEKQQIEQKVESLQKQIEQAAVVRISAIEVFPIRERRRGDWETTRARRVDKLQVCFTINSNPVSEPGNQEYFFRVTDPANQLMGTSPNNTFEQQGQQIPFTFRHIVWFQNEEKATCAEWLYNDFAKGRYTVSIFSQGKQVGQTQFELN